MATDNKKVVTSENMQADRQYLVDSGTNRLIMVLLFGGGIILASVLLFLASYGKTGRYVDPDRTQYEASLNAAATMLEGGTVAPDNADRVTLPIDTAIRATADKGLSAITASLKQVGAPPAPVTTAPVVEEVMVEEAPVVEEVVVEEPVVEETVVEETLVEEPVVETPVETVEVTETTTETVNTVVETVEVEAQPEVVETTSTTTVSGTTPTVETTTSTMTNTTSTTTSSDSNSMILGVSTAVAASTIMLPSGLEVMINKDVYSACVSCHQVNGQGIITVFPPLANHAAKLFNADRDYLANVVLYGLEGTIAVNGLNYNQPMRGYPELSDSDIAGVLNYILTTWGNESLLTEDFKPYEAKDIAGLRGQTLSPELMQSMRTTLEIN